VQDKKTKASYNPYSKQRLFRILVDMVDANAGANWSSLAKDIHLHRGVHFQRNNFYRLKDGTLSDSNVEIIVRWFEEVHDNGIRERLKPQAIFDEVGRSSRDYYYHLPKQNYYEEWREQILEEYSGVYFCHPTSDSNSYLPVSFIERYFADSKSFPTLNSLQRARDLPHYLGKRSILILQATPYGYFYAASYPFNRLYDLGKMAKLSGESIHEGIAYVSANTIHVQLRECLTRVVKTYTIVIRNKNNQELKFPFGLSIHVPASKRSVLKEWELLTTQDVVNFKNEMAESIDSPRVMIGQGVKISSSLPSLNTRALVSNAYELTIVPKPANILSNLDQHFVNHEQCNIENIQRIIDNPLSIGELT